MNILVCVKQTFDTEEKITVENGRVKEDSVRFVINPYDEYAVEEALRLKEEHGGKVTVISMGPERAEEALRTALAMGADDAVLADDSEFPGDEYTAAKVLAAVVRQREYDLILAGNQAVDDGSSQVAVRLAEELGIPHISTLTGLSVEDGSITGHRDAEGDEEIVVAKLPVLVTAQQGLNDPRYPSLIGIRRAGKKPLQHVTRADLGLVEEDLQTGSEIIETYLPKPKEGGKILSGDLPNQVAELVQSLKSVEKVIG